MQNLTTVRMELDVTTIRGSVDFLSPEFLHALGIAVATFSRLEGMLQIAIVAARHGSAASIVDHAAFPETAMEVYSADFSTKIDLLFKALRTRVKNMKTRGILDVQTDLHLARQARNFVVHGVWLPGTVNGSYRCSMVDSKGRTVRQEVDVNTLLSEATRAEHLMIVIKSLLVNEGIYPAIGPSLPD